MSNQVATVETVDYQENEQPFNKSNDCSTYRKPQLHINNLSKTIPEKRKPGRPRRKARTWFTDEELRLARRILGFLATPPPQCVCGESDWAFNIKDNRLRARCRQCQYEQWLSYETWKWTLEVRGDEANHEDKM